MWKHKMSREDVARRSGHDYGHVLELFGHEDPNPTLRLYLDLLEAAGARMDTANGNSVEHVVTRLGELRKRAGLSVAELARRSGMRRPHLSGIINGSRSNMQLAVFDVLVTVLGAEEEMMLVDRWYLAHEVLLALAMGDEMIAAGDGSPKSHLHVVSNASARTTGTSDAPRATASHSGTVSDTAPPPDDAERRAAEEKARATAEAEARAAAEARARAAEAETRAARERARAAERAARAEQERAEYERARAAEKAQQEKAAQERRAQEQARAEAAARAAAQLAAAAARAALQNKMMVGAGVVLAIVGGVCIAKGVAGLRANA